MKEWLERRERRSMSVLAIRDDNRAAATCLLGTIDRFLARPSASGLVRN